MRSATRADEAAGLIPDGPSVMVGGFLGVGTPERLVDAPVARGARGLTAIANDTRVPGSASASWSTRAASRAAMSHIGTNPVTRRMVLDGELEVELVPQGTLAERSRVPGTPGGGR